jgi:hypothetical protein
MNRVKLCLATLLCGLLLVGCFHPHIENQRDRALYNGDQMMDAYIELYQQYQAIHPVAAPSTQVFMSENIAPAMNALKEAIIAYNSAVVVWAATGEEQEGLLRLQIDITQSIIDIMTLFARAKGGE